MAQKGTMQPALNCCPVQIQASCKMLKVVRCAIIGSPSFVAAQLHGRTWGTKYLLPGYSGFQRFTGRDAFDHCGAASVRCRACEVFVAFDSSGGRGIQ